MNPKKDRIMKDNNATFIIRTGLTKKVGLPNFGSFGAECSVELVSDIGLLSSPEQLDQVRNQMYSLCLDSVESQIYLQLNKTEGKYIANRSTAKSEPSGVPQPPPPVKPITSECGKWFKDCSDKYGIPMDHIVNAVYGILIPNGTSTDWKKKGLELSTRWTLLGDKALQSFVEALVNVFDSFDNQK